MAESDSESLKQSNTSPLQILAAKSTDDEITPVESPRTEDMESEHQVLESHQGLGNSNSTETPAEVVQTSEALLFSAESNGATPHEGGNTEGLTAADNPHQDLPNGSAPLASGGPSVQTPSEQAEDSAVPEDIEPEDNSNEELWDEFDDALFEGGHTEVVPAGAPSLEHIAGPSAEHLAGPSTGLFSETSIEPSSQPSADFTLGAAGGQVTGPPTHTSPLAIELPPPATQDTVAYSQAEPFSMAPSNSITSSNSAEQSSDSVPSSLNVTQTPSGYLAQLVSNLNQLESSFAASSIVDVYSSTTVANSSTSAASATPDVYSTNNVANTPTSGASLIAAASAIVDAYSSNITANPSASAAAAHLPASTSSATASTEAEEVIPPKIGWSSLPAEVRRKIYNELLVVDMRQEQRDLCHHHLHLDILRVNQEIYKEALAVLYLRNTWIKITMDREVKEYLQLRINKLVYRKGRPTTRLYAVKFPRVAALNLVVYNIDKEQKQTRFTYVVSSFAMPQICRALVMPEMRTSFMFPLGLDLDSETAPEGAMWDQKGLLDCFVETRGVEALKVSKAVSMLARLRGKDGLAQLGAINLPFDDPDEIPWRASTYLNRGRKQVRTKHLEEARTTFQEGVDYLDWVRSDPYGVPSSMTASADDCEKLAKWCWQLIKGCVKCCIELGDLNLARTTLLSLFQKMYGPHTDKWADAYHMLGLIDLAKGAHNAALYSFLRALHARPGFEETDKAVDEMLERVAGKSDRRDAKFHDEIIRHNIEYVLKPFRHQPLGQASRSDAEAKILIGRFVGEICELHKSHQYQNFLPGGLVHIVPTTGS